MEDVVGMGSEMQTAKLDMEEQRLEMKDIGDIADKMMGHVEGLTAAFREIDEAQKKQNVVHVPIVNSTSTHVQGTSANVKEPVGHVQSVPTPIIDLVSEDSQEKGGWNQNQLRSILKGQ